MRVQHKIRKIKKDGAIVKHVPAAAIGIIIAAAIATCKGTQSYFTSTALAEGNMMAANPEDIIACEFERVIDPYSMTKENVTIDLNNHDSKKIINPDKIKIYNKTGKNCIVIFFALDDTISKYLRPINPADNFNEISKTEGNTQVKVSESEVPINTDINIEQFMSLLEGQKNNGSHQDKKDDEVSGEISIKYLNNYINKTQKISFSKDYLMMRFLKGIQDDLNSKLAQADSGENVMTSQKNTDNINTELTPEEKQVINYISPELLPKMNQLIEDKKSLQQVIDALQQKINEIMCEQAASTAAASITAPETPVAPESSTSAPDLTPTDTCPAGSKEQENAAAENTDTVTTKSDLPPEGTIPENSSSDASASTPSALEGVDSQGSSVTGGDTAETINMNPSASNSSAAEEKDSNSLESTTSPESPVTDLITTNDNLQQ